MAVVVGLNTGVPAATDPNLIGGASFPYFGRTAAITTATNAASASAQLPVDGNGQLYSAYEFISNALVWLNINTAGDAAVAAAANTYLINGNGIPVIIPVRKLNLVAGATAQFSVINDTAATSRVVCVGIL